MRNRAHGLLELLRLGGSDILTPWLYAAAERMAVEGLDVMLAVGHLLEQCGEFLIPGDRVPVPNDVRVGQI